MAILFLFAAFAIGALISMQPPINAQIAGVLGSPLLAATCSIAISLVLILAARTVLDHTPIQWTKFAQLPWWALIGGAAGAVFVIGALLIAPKIGVAAFFVFIVLGQLLGAAIIDHTGAFGVAVNPVTWWRAAGIALVVIGAGLTRLDAWL